MSYETENSQNVFSVSITHNSKIKELSDGNRVIVAKQPFGYGSHNFWVMSYGNWELSYGICQSKQPLTVCVNCTRRVGFYVVLYVEDKPL